MTPSALLLFVASALVSTSNAADYVVQVGVPAPTGQSGHRYSPDHVSGAVPGDTITFQFLPSGHTATEGTLATPCDPLAGGFDSGQYVHCFASSHFSQRAKSGSSVGFTEADCLLAEQERPRLILLIPFNLR
jgi:plastocyanin